MGWVTVWTTGITWALLSHMIAIADSARKSPIIPIAVVFLDFIACSPIPDGLKAGAYVILTFIPANQPAG
jgi:hypothetical protein